MEPFIAIGSKFFILGPSFHPYYSTDATKRANTHFFRSITSFVTACISWAVCFLMWMAVKRRASTKTISPSHLSNHPTLWVFLQTTSYLQHWRQAMIHITPFWHPINVNYNIDGGRAGRWSRGAGGAPFHINTVNIQSKVGSRQQLISSNVVWSTSQQTLCWSKAKRKSGQWALRNES